MLPLIADHDCRGHWADAGPALSAGQPWAPSTPPFLRVLCSWWMDAVSLAEAPAHQRGAGDARSSQLWFSWHLSFIVFALNTHFLELEHFTSLMGLFSTSKWVLKQGMIPEGFSYQVIGQVIKMWNEKVMRGWKTEHLHVDLLGIYILQPPRFRNAS